MKYRRGIDPMLSMINVVFLLLAFFLMGNFDPAPPKGFELPVLSEKLENTDHDRLFISKEGLLTWKEFEGEIAFNQIQVPIIVSADARLPAQKLITFLADLRHAGIEVSGLEVEP